TATTEIYTLSLYDALPICLQARFDCCHQWSHLSAPAQTEKCQFFVIDIRSRLEGIDGSPQVLCPRDDVIAIERCLCRIVGIQRVTTLVRSLIDRKHQRAAGLRDEL